MKTQMMTHAYMPNPTVPKSIEVTMDTRVAGSLATSAGMLPAHVQSLRAYEDMITLLATPSERRADAQLVGRRRAGRRRDEAKLHGLETHFGSIKMREEKGGKPTVGPPSAPPARRSSA